MFHHPVVGHPHSHSHSHNHNQIAQAFIHGKANMFHPGKQVKLS